MATIQTGSNTTGIANVDSSYALIINCVRDQQQSGFMAGTYQFDDGTVTGSNLSRSIRVSQDFRSRFGFDSILFDSNFEGTVISRSVFQQNLTNMTVSQSSGFLVLNAGSSTTNNDVAIVRTYRAFPSYSNINISADIWLKEANITATNTVSEWGFGYVSGTSAPTDGVFFRRASGGALTAVISWKGTESSASITTTNVPSRDGVGTFSETECNRYAVLVNGDDAQFFINKTLVATIKSPTTHPRNSCAQTQPIFMRVYISGGTSSAARSISIGHITVTAGDLSASKLWGNQLTSTGCGSYQIQAGTTSGQTANYTNSAAPSSANLSNSTADYATLGGQYQFAATATNETDWALFGYQNIAGTESLPGRTLYVTGIRIGEMTATGAAVGNGTMFFWAASAGATSVDLGTSDNATAVGPRIIPLGGQSFLAAAVQGTQSPGFFVDFSQAPLTIPPGCFFHIILKQLNGTNTTSLVFRGMVNVSGYFE